VIGAFNENLRFYSSHLDSYVDCTATLIVSACALRLARGTEFVPGLRSRLLLSERTAMARFGLSEHDAATTPRTEAGRSID